MKRVLVTGFGPFLDFEKNPSTELALYLEQEYENVTARKLPVLFRRAGEEMLEQLNGVRPDIVIPFGLNARISHFAIEEIALNVRTSEYKDTSGRITDDEEVASGGDLALRTNLPTVRMVGSLREEGIPAKRSFSAGSYICNEVFYTVLDWCSSNGSQGGFVHIPMPTEYIAGDPSRYATPHMSMDMIKRGGRVILDSVLKDPI